MATTSNRIQDQLSSVATHGDIMELAKITKKHMVRMLDERVDGLEANLGLKMGKVLEAHHAKALKKELDARTKDLFDRVEVYFASKMLAMEDERAEEKKFLRNTVTEIEGSYAKEKESLKNDHAKEMELLKEHHAKEMNFVRKAYETTIEHLREFLSNLNFPTPMVTLTMPELKIPEIMVRMPPPNIDIHVPEQKTPEVSIDLSQLHLPAVSVEMPKRKVKKIFEYNQHGLPASVTEIEE